MIYTLITRLVRMLPPETAHDLTVYSAERGWTPRQRLADRPELGVQVWDLNFKNPVGLAAGFDKNARTMPAMLNMGFGYVEIGTVTPKPQIGNPQPRLFRLTKDKAVINRMGFNNEGLTVFQKRLSTFRKMNPLSLVGANIGINKDQKDPVSDYVAGIKAVADLASYVVINVSSPNTPGLRDLQRREPIVKLISAAQTTLNELRLDRRPPLLIKIAPDITPEQLTDIAEIAVDMKLDGIIATNTTIDRPDYLKSKYKAEMGGLSGAPLKDKALMTLQNLYAKTNGQIPIIGVGGIATGQDAFDRIRAGASLVQLYTGLVYGGPRRLRKIKKDLVKLMQRHGYKSMQELIGSAVKNAVKK